MRAVLALIVLAGTAAAAPAPGAWIGQVQPSGDPLAPCADCALSPLQRAGTLVVLPQRDVAPPVGEVVIVQPLVGIALAAKVDKGRAAVPWFLFDRRDGDNGVLVLPPGAAPRIVEITHADLVEIRAALLKNEVLSHVGKAVSKIEAGGIDIDGDKRADFAVTYGCAAWGDGACQLRGQFFLQRHGAKWVELE